MKINDFFFKWQKKSVRMTIKKSKKCQKLSKVIQKIPKNLFTILKKNSKKINLNKCKKIFHKSPKT
jgi:hypothetical protein